MLIHNVVDVSWWWKIIAIWNNVEVLFVCNNDRVIDAGPASERTIVLLI